MMASGVKVEVPYNHDSKDLTTIYLGIADSNRPKPTTWKPAFRDINRDGKKPFRSVFALFPPQGRTVKVWIRDRTGDRPAHTQVV